MTVISTSHYNDQQYPNAGNGWNGGIGYDPNLGVAGALTFVNDPHGAVNYVGRWRATTGASQFGWGEGCEAYNGQSIPGAANGWPIGGKPLEGMDEWYSISYKTDPNFSDPIKFFAVTQFYCDDYNAKAPNGWNFFTGSPPMLISLGRNGIYASCNAGYCTLSAQGPSYEVSRYYPAFVPQAQMVFGTWIDILLHIVWSKGSPGYRANGNGRLTSWYRRQGLDANWVQSGDTLQPNLRWNEQYQGGVSPGIGMIKQGIYRGSGCICDDGIPYDAPSPASPSGNIGHYTSAGSHCQYGLHTSQSDSIVYCSGICRATTQAEAVAFVTSSGGGPPPPAAPTISGINPTSGLVGSSVVITGTGFTGATGVTFNGISTTFTVNSDTQITAIAPSPAGTATGPITVTTPSGSASSATFTVLSSLLPSPAALHTRVGSDVFNTIAVLTPDRKRVIGPFGPLPINSLIDQFYHYIGNAVATAGTVQAVVYQDNGGVPGALLGVSQVVTIPVGAADQWISLTPTAPISVTGLIWIGTLYGGGNADVGITTVTNSEALNTNLFSAGASNPFGTPTMASAQLAFVADYQGIPVPPGDFVFDKTREDITYGLINFLTDRIDMALVDAGFVPNQADPNPTFASIPSASVISTVTLSGKSVAGGVFSAADFSFPSVSAGLVGVQLISFKNTGTPSTSRLIERLTSINGLPITSAGGPIFVSLLTTPPRLFAL